MNNKMSLFKKEIFMVILVSTFTSSRPKPLSSSSNTKIHDLSTIPENTESSPFADLRDDNRPKESPGITESQDIPEWLALLLKSHTAVKKSGNTRVKRRYYHYNSRCCYVDVLCARGCRRPWERVRQKRRAKNLASTEIVSKDISSNSRFFDNENMPFDSDILGRLSGKTINVTHFSTHQKSLPYRTLKKLRHLALKLNEAENVFDTMSSPELEQVDTDSYQPTKRILTAIKSSKSKPNRKNRISLSPRFVSSELLESSILQKPFLKSASSDEIALNEYKTSEISSLKPTSSKFRRRRRSLTSREQGQKWSTNENETNKKTLRTNEIALLTKIYRSLPRILDSLEYIEKVRQIKGL